MPHRDEEILTEFDRRIRKGMHNAFFRKQPDRENPSAFWDIMGNPRSKIS